MNNSNTNRHDTGFYRIWDILGCKKRGIEPLIPVSRARWYVGIKSGKYPKGVSLGERTTGWRKSDIHALIASLNGGAK